MGTMVQRPTLKTAAIAVCLTGCASPFNQVQPCVLNCAVTLTGNPATAPVPVTVIEKK